MNTAAKRETRGTTGRSILDLSPPDDHFPWTAHGTSLHQDVRDQWRIGGG